MADEHQDGPGHDHGRTTGENWAEIDRLLDLTLGKDADEVERVLDRECHDEGLRRQLLRYLDAAAAPSPLDRSLGDQADELIALALGREAAGDCEPGEQIGAYRIDEVIGSGGMGTVFLAHRADGHFERHVALKILSRRAYDEGTHRRFLRERQILAGLQHPNIAALLDGGVTQAGVPYLVMELVEGESIVDFCRHRRLGLEARIRLLLQACQGVHHAHRHGVVHRDLKPSNILVAEEEEGEEKVFVVDFGIALPNDDVELTQTGQLLGTPGYMAPEQVEGRRETIDRRCDVFSLGVVLYELVTGEQPFHGETPRECLVRLLEANPTPPRKLSTNLSVDLDTVIMTCLAYEPSRRYRSVRALAEDLTLFLDDRPVRARSVGPLTRFSRRMRRHPKISAAFAAVVFAAFVAAGFAAHASWSATAQARAAQHFGQEVERIDALLRHAHLSPLHDMREQYRQVRQQMRQIESERQRLGRLAAGPGDYALGRAYLSLGDADAALVALDRAWQAGYREPQVASARGQAIGALYQRELEQARLIEDPELRKARYAQIEVKFREPAVAALRAGRGSEFAVSELTEVLIALYDGNLREVEARADEVMLKAPWMYEAKLLSGDAARTRAHRLRAEGRHEEALEAFEKAREFYLESAVIGNSDPATHLALCGFAPEVMESIFFERGGDVREWFETAEQGCGRAFEANPDAPDALVRLSAAQLLIARQAMARGQEALPAFAEALATGVRAVELAPEDEHAHRVVGDAHAYRSELLAQLGKDPGADLEAAISELERAIELNPNDVNAYNSLTSTYIERIKLEMSRGVDPQPFIDAAVAASRKAIRLLPTYTIAHNNLGIVYRLQGEYLFDIGGDPRPSLDLAASGFEEAIATNPSFSYSYNNLGNVFRDRGQYELSRGLDPTHSFTTALDAYDRTIKLNPEWAYPHLNAGTVRGLMGTFQRANQEDAARVLQQAASDFEHGIRMIGDHPLAHAELARVHLMAARNELEVGRSPRADLIKVEDAVGRSLGIDPAFALAEQIQGRAHLIAARHCLATGESPEAALDLAERWLTESHSLAPHDPATLLALARLELRRAEWFGIGGLGVQQGIHRGLDWVRQALAINDVLAEAFAVEALLLFEQAKQTTDPERQAARERQAESSMERAFATNPLLEREYGRLFDSNRR